MRLTIVVLCASALTLPTWANLLVNPEFTTWTNPNRPTGWFVEDTSKTRIEQSANPARSLPYAVKLTRRVSSTGNNAGIQQYVPVSPNLDYTLSAWFLDDDVNASGGCGISWYTQDTTFISSTTNAYTDSAIRTWQRVVKAAAAPSTARLAKAFFRVYGFTGSPAGGIVYLDDASFVQGSGIKADEVTAGRSALGLCARPNPSLGHTVLNVTLPRSANISLEVFDLTGTLVSSVFSGRLDAGTHLLPWNATDRAGARLTTGLYFAVLTDGHGNTSVSKLTLER